MLDLCIVRHGETAWNRGMRFQGQSDIPLNDMGRLQAERVAQALAQERADRVLCSDLIRTVQTAMPTALALGAVPRPHRGWREQSFGVFEGLTAPVIRARYPEIWERWVNHEADFAVPGGGESHAQVQARLIATLEALEAQYSGERLLVFSHGAVLDMLWRTASGLSLTGPRTCVIPNCGINRLRWQHGTLDVLSWAEAEHLTGLPEQPSTVPASTRLALA